MKGQVQDGLRRRFRQHGLAVDVYEPGPWTKAGLQREFSDGTEPLDALSRLVARGLVVKMKGDFYVATAFGRYAHEVESQRA